MSFRVAIYRENDIGGFLGRPEAARNFFKHPPEARRFFWDERRRGGDGTLPFFKKGG